MEKLMTPRPAVIERIRPETADTLVYTLRFAEPEVQQGYTFQPGQFNEISIFGVGEAPISISSDPNNRETFEHTVRVVGNVTRALARLREGSHVGVRGPYGKGWPMERLRGHNILLIAGGIGLAPLRPVIQDVLRHADLYGSLEILYGARSPAELLYVDEYDVWDAHPQIRLRLSVDRMDGTAAAAATAGGGAAGAGASNGMTGVGVAGPASALAGPQVMAERVKRATVALERYGGQVGPVTVLFDQMVTSPRGAVVITCGPEIMMKYVALGLVERGWSPEQIFVSLERRMECGVAQCGHCQIGPLYVCKDGPVFCYKDIRYLPEAVF
ncbi:MAG TPA: Ni/Fe hydrogenase subunit gamma [Firmicutes bacterium]|nr:Ni/Fe hydrogenase subunit gamma [Bacillota bacterium]